jgi:hypothetical protein
MRCFAQERIQVRREKDLNVSCTVLCQLERERGEKREERERDTHRERDRGHRPIVSTVLQECETHQEEQEERKKTDR